MLENPGSSSDLYLASQPEQVEICRPFMTGDIFQSIQVSGVDPNDNHLGIVLTHPCSMRSDGVRLAPLLHIAPVGAVAEIPLKDWETGHFKVMPLPELMDEHYAARFTEMGLVDSTQLLPENRVACLSPFGIHLLQQRFIWYLTRFLAPTHRLAEATEAVFAEADLEEEWVIYATEHGDERDTSRHSFHMWLRATDESGTSRQERLSDPQRRAGIRRDMQHHLMGH